MKNNININLLIIIILMIEKIENKKIDLEEFIKNINKDIFNGELGDIIELTYAYTDLGNGKFLNRTLFEDLTGEKFNGNNLDKLYELFLEKLNKKKDVIEKYKNQLDSVDMDKNRKDILNGSLTYVLNSINLAILGANFEYEKAGGKLNINDNEKVKIIKQMEDIEKKLYDGKVIDNPKEVQQCYNFLINTYIKNSNILSNEEKKLFEKYLKDLKEKTEDFKLKIENKENNESKKNNESKEILDKKIKREDYIKIFKLVFDIYGIDKPIIVDERSSIYDGEDALYIPKLKNYNYLPIKRVLQLISHEIEVHFIVEQNNKENLGNFRGGKNLNREEGTAKLSETLLFGKKLDDIGITVSLPDILMGELLSGKDYENYLKIVSKLRGVKYSEAKLLRKKRNYPFYFSGVQHKDTSYSRGILQVVDYLKSGKDPKDLFLGKVSFEDIDKIKKLSQHNNQKYPFLLAELLLYILSGKKIYHKDFIKYIKEKYSFIDVDKEYKNGTVKKLTFDIKRKLVDILETLKK